MELSVCNMFTLFSNSSGLQNGCQGQVGEIVSYHLVFKNKILLAKEKPTEDRSLRSGRASHTSRMQQSCNN